MKHFLFIFIVSNSLLAQNFNPKVDQTNACILYSGNHILTSKLAISTDFAWRRNNGFEKPMRNAYRLSLDYLFNKKIIATLGLSYLQSFAYGDFATEIPSKYNQYDNIEFQIWEQLQINNEKLGRFYTDSRFRLENRFIENKVKDVTGEYVRDNEQISGLNAEAFKIRNRFRYRYRVQIPISKPEMIDKTLFLTISDEIFANIGTGVTANIFDQNRLTFTIGWRFNKNYNIQAGYMNQFIEKSDGVHKENNHTSQIAFLYNLDFSKKK